MERDALAAMSREQLVELVLTLAAEVADISADLTSLLTTARKRGENLFHALQSVNGPSRLHAAGLPT